MGRELLSGPPSLCPCRRRGHRQGITVRFPGVRPPTDGQQREETAKSAEKNMLIPGKRRTGVRAISSIAGLVVLVSVVTTVVLALASAGYLLRAVRRKVRKEEIPLDWYTVPGPRLGFDSESSAIAARTVGPSIWKRCFKPNRARPEHILQRRIPPNPAPEVLSGAA